MPASSLVKEYFSYWVVTTDPVLTSAKFVTYGTEVSINQSYISRSPGLRLSESAITELEVVLFI